MEKKSGKRTLSNKGANATSELESAAAIDCAEHRTAEEDIKELERDSL